jgi:hypothetical protein
MNEFTIGDFFLEDPKVEDIEKASISVLIARLSDMIDTKKHAI